MNPSTVFLFTYKVVHRLAPIKDGSRHNLFFQSLRIPEVSAITSLPKFSFLSCTSYSSKSKATSVKTNKHKIKQAKLEKVFLDTHTKNPYKVEINDPEGQIHQKEVSDFQIGVTTVTKDNNTLSDLDYEKILSLEIELSDAPNTTIRSYLKKLLKKVWTERECFDGKRPFGFSDWQYDIYTSLAKKGYVKASFDEKGDLKDIDSASADKIISDVINYQFKSKHT